MLTGLAASSITKLWGYRERCSSSQEGPGSDQWAAEAAVAVRSAEGMWVRPTRFRIDRGGFNYAE